MAFSAIRAGFRPICFDYFADADLQRAVRSCGTTVTKIAGYDSATLRLIGKLSSEIPLMYGGAVENHQDFVDAISNQRPVWGLTGDTLKRCRNPWVVQEYAAKHGFYELACHRDKPERGDWIWKPFASGGGIDIDNPKCGKLGFWQQRVQGWGTTSTFGVIGHSRDVRWVGHSELDAIGETVRCFGEPLRNDEAITPSCALDDNITSRQLDKAIANLAIDLGIVGCFGVDMIDDDLVVFDRCILEINPRFTATAELHERVSGVSFVELQADVFCRGRLPKRRHAVICSSARKLVFFAPFDLRSFIVPPTTAAEEFPMVADVPPIGTRINKDEPICTVFLHEDVQSQKLIDRLQHSVMSQCQPV